MDKLLSWIKQHLGLCQMTAQWHFARTYRVFHGWRYCAECWRTRMTDLPTSTRAWRIEHTGVAT